LHHTAQGWSFAPPCRLEAGGTDTMPKIEPRILKGFQDFLPEVMIARRQMLNAVCAVFERFGFSPLDTPALEYSEILLGKMGEEAEKLLYRFKDNGERDVCMRYDLTVPLARVVAMNRNLPMPFKRYQVGNVWRAESPGRGRFREFTQCDVDVVGTASLLADAECLAVDAAVMTELGVSATIRFNNRKVFRALQEKLGIEEQVQMDAVLRAVDKLPKIGEDGVAKELKEQAGLSESLITQTLDFCRIGGSNAEVLAKLSGMFGGSDAGKLGVAELREVLDAAVAMGVPESMLAVDPSVARGLDYYTGTVFETFINDLPGFGSVMSGGRYDGLIGLYAGQEIPAVGISVGLDRLLAGLQELGRVSCPKTVTEVLVLAVGVEQKGFALETTAKLRAAGVSAEVYYDAGAKLKKQFKYADALSIPLVALIGSDEAAAGAVTLRDMTDGSQAQVPLAGLAAEVRGRNKRRAAAGSVAAGAASVRTWAWAWDEASLARLPDRRGVYILRDNLKVAVECGYAGDPGLRAALAGQYAEKRGLGITTFDWYEVGDEGFGTDLAAFLTDRLVEAGE
jgi:histidyl-tRNA synthetase